MRPVTWHPPVVLSSAEQEEHLERWRKFRDLPPGGIMTPEQCRQLACAWYADKLRSDWQRKTLEDAEATLAGIGLTSASSRLSLWAAGSFLSSRSTPLWRRC